MDKLCSIQICIDNDMDKIESLIYHLDAMCKMREKELQARGITMEEWDKFLRSKQQ